MPNTNVTIDELKAKAKELRANIVETTFSATSGHIGGSLSAADMLVALYFKYYRGEMRALVRLGQGTGNRG